MARRIQAPGIEINEIDYSSYETSESLVNTTAFIMGFADKGTDYATRYVSNMNNYVKMFGTPHTEAETYLYNATNEIISKGGNVYVSKLPYDNNSLNKYSYVDYTIDTTLNLLSSPYDIVCNYKYGNVIMKDFLLYTNIDLSVPIPLLETEGLLIDDIIHNEKNIEIEETDDIIRVSDEIPRTMYSFCDRYDINLYLIEDFKDFILNNYNFTEQEKQLLNNLFYVELSGEYKFKNDSAYIISTLIEDTYNLSTYNILDFSNVEIFNSINKIKDKIKFSQKNYQKIEYMFLNSRSLEYYNDYINYLKEKLNEIQYSDAYLFMDFYKENLEKISINDHKYNDIKRIDNTITSYININPISETGTIDINVLDDLKIKNKKVENNTIRIVDITRSQYKTEFNIEKKEEPREYLGILPVITTAPNAIYYQNIIENSQNTFSYYNTLCYVQNVKTQNEIVNIENDNIEIKYNIENINNDTAKENKNVGFVYNLGSEDDTHFQQMTYSKIASSYFPNIQTINDRFNRKHLKDIGVVVFKMFIDTSLDYKISLTPVESYVGSLNRYEIDEDTKEHRFIDDIINENSKLINFFSNVKFSKHEETQFTNIDRASTFIISNQTATSLGFYKKDCLKHISLQESIYNAIDKIFDKNVDINEVELDFLVDAGVSNIAQFIKSVYPITQKGYYDFDEEYAYLFKLESSEDTDAWKKVIEKYNNYCKNIRKDCMFIADGLRPLCLIGNEKVVRNTKPENTINNTIIKNVKYISSKINSSYGAGYLNWFLMINTFNNELFWCPPSIKAAGIYIYTDLYSYYWNAPAGLNRGKLDSGVVDVAFSPNLDQAGIIYNNCWNYSVNYPIDGIVLEGQKTFQRDKTAFDRVNVRRLFLGLEKEVRYIAKYFKYDQITDYMMTRFVDAITPIFEEAKNKGGIKEYVILCDRNNNTIQTIENNELHCTIGVKSIKSGEFICLNFICTNQSADVQEIVQNF